MPVTAPHITTIRVRVPGQATAGTDSTFAVGVAPYAATVTKVSYITDDAITGHASNNRTFSLVNRGASGSGTTSVATITSNASTSFTAFDEKALTLSATAANRVVAEGDVLAFFSDANASGVADPGGLVVIELSRN